MGRANIEQGFRKEREGVCPPDKRPGEKAARAAAKKRITTEAGGRSINARPRPGKAMGSPIEEAAGPAEETGNAAEAAGHSARETGSTAEAA